MRTLYSSTRASLDQVIDFQPLIEPTTKTHPSLKGILSVILQYKKLSHAVQKVT